MFVLAELEGAGGRESWSIVRYILIANVAETSRYRRATIAQPESLSVDDIAENHVPVR